ncbi:MAG: hypothetical protein JWN74_236 [Acidobacteriaceae bacterium]|nr:hypothetical protein [Acidobacteriaceae bacterium]
MFGLTGVCLFALSGLMAAQSKPAAPTDDRGLTSHVEFGGTSDADGQVYELQSNVGYTFTKHFGMDLGVPVYFVSASSSTSTSTTGGTSSNGIGNPSVDLRWKYPNAKLNYGSVVTGSAPLADSKKGLSTGRATFDWTNRIDRSFSMVNPFFEVGLSNTTSDSRLFVRPYTTLGLNSHFQAGASFDVWKSISVGGSMYDIVPFGNQTVFSRVTGASDSGAGASHGRNFQTSQQTTGGADIAKDDGFSTFVDFSPNSYMDAELGYTRSIHYALNSVSFSVGFNVRRLLHKSQ